MAERPRRRIPEATVARLPVYLRSLLELNGDLATVSSERLAEMAGVNAAKVRKDLSYLGSYGTRGVGYDVEYLLFQMSRELGLTQDWPVVIVGVGNLGQALANYGGFGDRGFPVAALVDVDATKVGTTIGRHVVHHVDDLPRLADDLHIAIGIIATPAGVAQDVADRLVAAGVTSVLNFAPAVVTVPEGASLRKVDLAVELQILSFYQQRRAALAATGPGPATGSGNGSGSSHRDGTSSGGHGSRPACGRGRPWRDGRRERAGLMPVDGALYPVNLRLAGRSLPGGGRRARWPPPRSRACSRPGPRSPWWPPRWWPSCGVGSTPARCAGRPGATARARSPATASSSPPPTTGPPTRPCSSTARSTGSGSTRPTIRQHCAFTLPARVRQGPLLVTFATGGRSPALSSWLRRRYDRGVRPRVRRAHRPAGPRARGAAGPRRLHRGS